MKHNGGFLRGAAGIFLRGFAMGLADLVPGVSGGTVALLCGIYERLVAALRALLGAAAWRALSGGAWRDWRVRDFARRVDLVFLGVLLGGVLSAVLLCAGTLESLLERKLHLVLAFFLGLVLASIVAVARRLRRWRWGLLPPALLGVLVGLLSALLPPIPGFAEPGAVALFLGGAVAICAMLLPGLSGSYVLLLLGLYPTVISALHERDALLLGAFWGGCIAGLLCFVRLLHWLLCHRYDSTLGFLLGLMVGGLQRLWPWKQQEAGAEGILQPNLSPMAFSVAGENPQIVAALVLLVGGALLALMLDSAGRRLVKPVV